MRRTSTPRVAARAAAALSLLLALGACGSETSDGNDAGGDTGSDEGFDVTTATLTDQPFCDRIDTAMVAEVLGLPADKVKSQVDRSVGEEFEGPNEEGQPPTSVANLCVLGSTTSQFTLSVQPDAGTNDVQSTIDELSSLTGKGSAEVCEATDATAFGEPAGSFTCTSGPPIDRVRVVATGLVGGSKFYCGVIVNQGAGPELPEATLDACRTMLEELASEA